MKRRQWIAQSAFWLAGANQLLARAGVAQNRLGICTFSCHQQWLAVQKGTAVTDFQDALSFADYALTLGASGVQTSLRVQDEAVARSMRQKLVERGFYYEGEIRFPEQESELDRVAEDLRLAALAGASVARMVCMNGRRYETFRSSEEFEIFHQKSVHLLEKLEPLARKHGVRIALENHKDHTAEELAAVMQHLDSEWVGVLYDTGNNLSLLELPEQTLKVLSPYVNSIHLKDMGVQPYEEGFLLSEVPLGTGHIDLVNTVKTLCTNRPELRVHLEMATRDPLQIPCLSENYFNTFPARRESHLDKMLAWVGAHPLREPAPSVSDKTEAERIKLEENLNRRGLQWMSGNLIS